MPLFYTYKQAISVSEKYRPLRVCGSQMKNNQKINFEKAACIKQICIEKKMRDQKYKLESHAPSQKW